MKSYGVPYATLSQLSRREQPYAWNFLVRMDVHKDSISIEVPDSTGRELIETAATVAGQRILRRFPAPMV